MILERYIIRHVLGGILVVFIGLVSLFFIGDLIVDLIDATHLLAHLFASGPEPVPPAAGDFDGDGSLQLPDAINLLTYLFLQGDPPAPPFPEPGCAD